MAIPREEVPAVTAAASEFSLRSETSPRDPPPGLPWDHYGEGDNGAAMDLQWEEDQNPPVLVDGGKVVNLLIEAEDAAGEGRLDEGARRTFFERLLPVCEGADELVARSAKVRFVCDLELLTPELPRFEHPARPDAPRLEADYKRWIIECRARDAAEGRVAPGRPAADGSNASPRGPDGGT